MKAPIQTLLTERLVLDEVKESDSAAVFFLRSDPAVLRYLDRKPAANEAEALEWIKMIRHLYEDDASFTWAIRLKGHAELIGTIGFWNIQKEHYRSEIGYVLHPNQQGKGYMLEALNKVLDIGFEQYQFHSIEANVNPANRASIKLLERANFQKEAHFKENYFYDGKFLDSAIYCLRSRERIKP